MSILETIQQATNDAGFKGLSFANLQEYAAFAHSFQFEEYPRNIVVPFTVNGRIVGQGRKKKVLVIQGWAMTRITEDTNDWRSVELEPKYMTPMRDLAEKFIVQLSGADFVDSEVDDIPYSIRAEYMWLANHLFGVAYTVSLPITGKIC